MPQPNQHSDFYSEVIHSLLLLLLLLTPHLIFTVLQPPPPQAHTATISSPTVRSANRPRIPAPKDRAQFSEHVLKGLQAARADYEKPKTINPDHAYEGDDEAEREVEATIPSFNNNGEWEPRAGRVDLVRQGPWLFWAAMHGVAHELALI